LAYLNRIGETTAERASTSIHPYQMDRDAILHQDPSHSPSPQNGH